MTPAKHVGDQASEWSRYDGTAARRGSNYSKPYGPTATLFALKHSTSGLGQELRVPCDSGYVVAPLSQGV